ncbi:MAG TPA: PVC-type heme-binding CxxCH protein [Planctomycetaceae bacterium]|nr:PVC-type heme-binding CxxCH protein [Planctomycetaceae bacterium]
MPKRHDRADAPKLMPAAEATASMTVPPGFHVSLFASEPVIQQPIGMATDSRGRLWVAENNTYSDARVNFDLTKHDRIVILEDTDHDGRADRQTVFWDQAQKLTSVEIGFGGVWALCPPQLLFIPDRNGDDIPDGKPQVVLDGWDDGVVRHNIANGLRWGPDGWLYGRHGIQATSYVGAPGTLPSQRTPLNCCIWRYHPTRKIFEVVCRGTTNPWGMDWNPEGELFFINTVIGHLWHAVPGAHFQRMYGEDDNPHVYELLGQTADHFHWDTAEHWSAIRKIGVSPTTDQAGGGHAHAGLMIYQGGNWPDRYRGSMFTLNMHGRRLNNDTLERRGSGYVGRHAADFLKSSDPWFRGLELIASPDGGAFIADWSDFGECHGADGVDINSGRIFKVVYGETPRPKFADVAKLSDAELVGLQTEKNDWLVRQSRRILQERNAAGQPMQQVHASLKTLFAGDPDPVHKLRALWCLYVTGGAPDAWLLNQLHHPDEHVRVWALRLLGDGKPPSAEAIRAFSALAPRDPSGLVLLYLASALQEIPSADRWSLAEALAARADFAADPVLPLMIWYGIEPAVPEEPSRAVHMAESSPMLTLVRCIARRLTENLKLVPLPVDRLVTLAGEANTTGRSRAILTGMAEALRGWRKAPLPATWKSVQSALEASSDKEVRRLARELSVVFGDGRALADVMRIAASKSSDPAARHDAVRVLVEARGEGTVPLLCRLLDDRDVGPDAARGLAAFDDPSLPALLLTQLPKLRETVRDAAIVTLCARPNWARLLLAAVASGQVDRARVPAFQVRQMSTFPGEDFRKQVAALWPELKSISATKRKRIDQLKHVLTASTLSAADRPNGRQRFAQTCATCHTLFGQGAKIGPDLTGGQRTNLDYLLENIIDPSALVAPAYRMSTVVLADGRVLNGILNDQSGPTLTVQTPTERLLINRSEIEEVRKSELSLMPEGQLDVLAAKDVRDLIAYLMSPQQVPLPAGKPNGEARASK